MITDPIADFLTHIRNACIAGHQVVTTPASKKKESILKMLAEEGYVESYERVVDTGGKPQFKIFLVFTPSGKPVIREIKRLSKPGRRRYVNKSNIPRYKGGLGTLLISTSEGVMSGREARKRGLGGEPLCSVF